MDALTRQGEEAGSAVLDLRRQAAPARAARRFAVAHAELFGLHGIVDAVALVVAELATNAVLHTAGPLAVRLVHVEDGVLVAIDDPSSVLPRVQPHSVRAGTGRGMQLTDSYAREWGSAVLPGGGKRVWAVVTPASVAAAETVKVGARSGGGRA